MTQQNPDTAYDDERDRRDDEDIHALERMGIPRDAERFNTQGQGGRNCPVCFRAGSLNGERTHLATLTCGGCATRFVLFLAPDLLYDNTLVRLTPRAPACAYTPVPVRDRFRDPS